MSTHCERCRRIALVGAAALTLAACAEPGGRATDFSHLRAELRAAEVELVNVWPAQPDSRKAPPSSREAFLAWQRTTRAKLRSRLAFDAPADSTAFRIVHRASPPGLVRRHLVFESFDGSPIPAVLQYPSDVQPRAAVLLIPGHVRSQQSGLAQLVDEQDSYQHAAATRLAQQGYMTLTFELRGFGLLGAELDTNHLNVARNAIAVGSSYKSVAVRDAAAAIGVLRQQPGASAERIAVTGASLGGELAVTLGAVDERIAVVAFSSFGGSAGAYPLAVGADARAHHYCHVIPGSQDELHAEDLLLLIAPRPLAGFRGAQDGAIAPGLKHILNTHWQLLDVGHRIDIRKISGGGHEFFVAQTLDFLNRTFPP